MWYGMVCDCVRIYNSVWAWGGNELSSPEIDIHLDWFACFQVQVKKIVVHWNTGLTASLPCPRCHSPSQPPFSCSLLPVPCSLHSVTWLSLTLSTSGAWLSAQLSGHSGRGGLLYMQLWMKGRVMSQGDIKAEINEQSHVLKLPGCSVHRTSMSRSTYSHRNQYEVT